MVHDVLLPEDTGGVDFPGLEEHLESLRYPDGSYAYESKLAGRESAADLYGTPHAACAARLLGVGPKKETLDYIDGRKNGDGTFRGGYAREAELEGIYWCVLALKMGGREVPKETISYVKSLRRGDGSYGLGDDPDAILKRTGQAITVLKLAGTELSQSERDETAGYIIEKLGDENWAGDVDSCYGAAVSLNLLGREIIAPELREIVNERVAIGAPDYCTAGGSGIVSYGKLFKARMARIIVGIPDERVVEEELREFTALQRQPFPLGVRPPSFPVSAEEAYYALLLEKLKLRMRNR